MIKKLNELKFLESLKSFKFQKTTKRQNPLKSLNSIKFDQAKTAKAASSIVLFGFSGWFLWHTFLAIPEPTLPPSLPQITATVNPAPAEQPSPSVVEPIETTENQTLVASKDLADELQTTTETSEEANDISAQRSPEPPQELFETYELAAEPLALSCEETKSCINHPILETTTLANVATPVDAPQVKRTYALTARSNLDARECLNLTDNMAIRHCAENYR